MSTEDFTFEDRARQAATGINEAVNTAELQLFAAGIPALRTAGNARRRFDGSERWVAAAGAFAAILIVVGIAMLPGRLFSPDSEGATTEATTPNAIVAPIDSTPDFGPAETIPVDVSDPEPTTTVPPENASTIVPVDSTAPDLTVDRPDDGVTVSEYLMQFRGTTEPGATVLAAGEWKADVDELGNWEIILGLNSGSNIVTFTARDDAGNETTAQIIVNYDPPSPTTSTTGPDGEPGPGDGEGTEEEATAFAAFAQFETCEVNPPFNVYWGTAPAGDKVTILSPFGEDHQVYAVETGSWEIRVEFPDAPYNEGFVVTVKHVASGESLGFESTSFVEG